MIVAYDALADDEVSVQIGDEVEVISKVTDTEWWWKVRDFTLVCLT